MLPKSIPIPEPLRQSSHVREGKGVGIKSLLFEAQREKPTINIT